MVVIFSAWKTMVGTAVTSLPWAFQQSGMMLGLLGTLVGFFISYYTCMLIIRMAGDDPDYCETLRKFYGKSLLTLTILFRVERVSHRANCTRYFDCWCNYCLLRYHGPSTVSRFTRFVLLERWKSFYI